MATSILIADDSALSRKMIRRALPKEWDVEVTEASNGSEAITACRDAQPTVMFLDLTMPDLDGYQVLEQLHNEGLSSLVIIISADIQEKAQERTKALGAAAFIKKPIAAGVIEEILKEHGVL